MPRLCRFTIVNSKMVVYVNPAKVRLVRSDPAEGGTIVVFDNDHRIVVADDAEAVVKAIEGADSA
jgi:hypothetical protein